MNLREVASLALIKQKTKWVIYLQAAAWLSHDLNSSTKHFPQPLNVREFSDVKKREIHTAEPVVAALSAFGVEMAVGKLIFTNHQAFIKYQQNLLTF
jgi:hypothetical protein